MNEEIKVLSYLQKYIDKNKQDEEWIIKGNILETPAMIGYLETKELLNYIINLQEENKKLVKVIDELEEYILNHYIVGHTVQNASLDDILNKITELKGGSDEKVESEE